MTPQRGRARGHGQVARDGEDSASRTTGKENRKDAGTGVERSPPSQSDRSLGLCSSCITKMGCSLRTWEGDRKTHERLKLGKNSGT